MVTLSGGSAIIENTTIADNQSTTDYPLMELWASSNKVVNSIVTNNSVNQGQHLIKSTEPLQILHSVITSNTSGLFTHRRNLDIANSIIVDNGVNQIVTSNGGGNAV